MSAFRILGEGQLSLTKFLLATDQNVDLKDFKKTLEHILCRSNPETDLYIFSNLSMDTLDYTGPKVNEGSKGVWLGLGNPIRELPREFQGGEDLTRDVSEVRVFCPGCLVVGGADYEKDPEAGQRIVTSKAFKDWPLLVLSDEPERAASSSIDFLWTTFTRFEPAADIHSAKKKVVRNHVCFGEPILIDARLKPEFPDELECSEEISELVTKRWKEYFPSGSPW
jgi:3-polyprenyl-4-hydroxybenzoate decarboxylase